MENKYFTPSIEDIRVGYECESHEWSMDEAGIPELNYDRWVKITLDKNYVKTLVEYGIRGIRVPYLTKEQIEGEGWDLLSEYKSGNYWLKFQKIPKIGNPIILHYNDEKWLILSQESLIKHAFPIQYSGECKDINTFRYICKLLNIK